MCSSTMTRAELIQSTHKLAVNERVNKHTISPHAKTIYIYDSNNDILHLVKFKTALLLEKRIQHRYTRTRKHMSYTYEIYFPLRRNCKNKLTNDTGEEHEHTKGKSQETQHCTNKLAHHFRSKKKQSACSW